jgi:hypothetical protein
MPDNKSRVRDRAIPVPHGPVLTRLGWKESRSNLSQPWTKIPGSDVYYNGVGALGYPGLYIERTWDETHGHFPYKTGGPFKSIKIDSCKTSVNDVPQKFSEVVGSGIFVRNDNLERYVGGFMLPTDLQFGSGFSITPYSTILSPTSSHFVNLSGYGDSAYAKLRPKLEQASGGVFLAELSDLPHMLKTTSKGFHDIWKSIGGKTVSRIMQPKKTADHFLNHQFGWVPFLNDLDSFYKTFRDTEILVAKLTAQNNQWVRKRATIAESVSVSLVPPGVISGNILFPNTSLNGTDYNNGGPFYYLVDRTTTTVSASGKFRYYRPEFDMTREDYSSALRSIQRQLTLYGLRISPSNIYKATPWTWAIDWVSNAGKFIDRANDYLLDSVASQYLFVSCHTKKERILVQFLPFKSRHTILSFSRSIDIKQRQEDASPYGFNLSVANLTPRQLAIAGALGITRW